jgi:hypothetical protein
MESLRGQQNQTASGDRADSGSKGSGSEACAATYLTCWLPGRKGLTRKAHGKCDVNLCLKLREMQAAKMGDDTRLVRNGNGIRGMRYGLACPSDRMMLGAEQVPKSLVIVHVKELREAFMQSYVIGDMQGG